MNTELIDNLIEQFVNNFQPTLRFKETTNAMGDLVGLFYIEESGQVIATVTPTEGLDEESYQVSIDLVVNGLLKADVELRTEPSVYIGYDHAVDSTITALETLTGIEIS